MTRRLPSFAAALLLSTALAAPALGLPATQAGADRIMAAFRTYFGPVADAATVTPQGDSYALTISPAPIFTLLGKTSPVPGSPVTGTFTPLAFTLTDEGGGQWGVSFDQPISAAIDVPGVTHAQYSIKSYKISGTFDEALGVFSTMNYDATGMTMDQTAIAPDTPRTREVVTIDSEQGVVAGSANAGGGVDLVNHAHISGYTQKSTATASGGLPAAVPTKVSVKSGDQMAYFTGLRTHGLMNILAWLVAHPDQASRDAAQAEVKPLFNAALPVFNNFAVREVGSGVSADTPAGPVGFDMLSVALEANGLGSDGKLRLTVKARGLGLPPGMVPPWAEPLVPQTAELDTQVTGYDSAAAIAVALTALDLPPGQEPGPDFENHVLAAFLPRGTVTMALNPSAVEGAGYKLSAEGSMDAGPDTTEPTGQAKVTLSGMETIRKALAAAPHGQGTEAMMVLGAFAGIANPEADGSLTWNIDATTPGKVLINGMDVSQMGGGQ